jgi:hypothetical protein
MASGLLAACGGDMAVQAEPTTVNRAPAFTSPTAASIINTNAVVYVATASGHERQRVDYADLGGADRLAFAHRFRATDR